MCEQLEISTSEALSIAACSPSAAALLDLPIEVLIDVCGQLDFRDLIRVAATCKRFRHGDNEMETAELPTKSPVFPALREHAFPGGVGIPSTRPIGCSESWVAYLARCARQRRFREVPPIAAGFQCTLFVDVIGRLLSCGRGAALGHGDEAVKYSSPIPVAAAPGLRMRSVAAEERHSLALGWDGQVYSWGRVDHGQLGHGDRLNRPSPALVEGLENVRSIATNHDRGFAVTHSGAVFQWGKSFRLGAEHSLRPIIVEGFGGVRVRRVYGVDHVAFAIGEDGEVFS
jgi:hypothetical protein